MKAPQCILHLGYNSHQGDFISDFEVPIYWQYIKSSNDEKIFMGITPTIREMLMENKQYTVAMLSINERGIIFFARVKDEWIVD